MEEVKRLEKSVCVCVLFSVKNEKYAVLAQLTIAVILFTSGGMLLYPLNSENWNDS